MQFPVLDLENIVQINDKTRLSAIKSFVSKGAEADFVSLTIKPEESADPISIMDDERRERYLDWVYTDFTSDIDSTNCKIYFTLGVTDYIATVASGTYTLSALAVAIKTAMDTAASSTFTVVVDSVTSIFTLSNALPFVLSGQTALNALLPHIGFPVETQNKTSHIGKMCEYVFKKITLTMSGDMDLPTVSKSFYIKIISKEGDKLFSSDQDLLAYESDIMNWVQDGRASFLDIHRKVQSLILKYLEQNNFVLDDTTPITKNEIVDIKEVNDWACFMVLRLIYQNIHNDEDDIFKEKAKEYEKFEIGARNVGVTKIDLNKDGKIDNNEVLTISSGVILRR